MNEEEYARRFPWLYGNLPADGSAPEEITDQSGVRKGPDWAGIGTGAGDLLSGIGDLVSAINGQPIQNAPVYAPYPERAIPPKKNNSLMYAILIIAVLSLTGGAIYFIKKRQ